jgi:hypothetical protein
MYFLLLATAVIFALVGCSSNHDLNGPANSSGQRAMNPALQGEGDLGDLVWADSNCNGIQDRGEAGMPDVTVKLYTCQDSLLQTMTTDTLGHYLFGDIPPGQYVIRFVLPEGFAFSPIDQGDNDSLDSDANPRTGNTVCITLDSSEVDLSWDAGMCRAEEQGCTFSMGYWKNHAGFGPQADVVTPLLPIWLGLPDSSASLHVDSAQVAYDVLRMRTFGVPSNGITKLYAQLLAAKLNIANGANSDDVARTIARSDEFLSTHGWQSWSTLNRADRQIVLGWMETLASYNEGFIGPGSCDEDEEDMY